MQPQILPLRCAQRQDDSAVYAAEVRRRTLYHDYNRSLLALVLDGGERRIRLFE